MVPADVALVVRFPSNRRFFNDVFTAYQELFSGEALLTRLISHDGNGNEKIQNKSTSLMSKTKTLNARASHFSGGSVTALFGKILCCQRKSNLVNLDDLPMPAIVTVASNRGTQRAYSSKSLNKALLNVF